ncbi:MAG: hypothetical protein ACFFE4_19205 [Candidatus Thorarchaeota archaeon]
MKRNKGKKQFKFDKWNEISRNREEAKTKEEDLEWNEKDDEDEEMGENRDEFHESDYDT